jgi:hypothetical protein
MHITKVFRKGGAFARIVTACIATSLMSCALSTSHILETKEINRFQVQQTLTISPVKIRLSGQSMHSALAVYKIKTSESEGVLQIIVDMRLADDAHRTGGLDYPLTVPDSVHTVVFGNEKTLIWTRQP